MEEIKEGEEVAMASQEAEAAEAEGEEKVEEEKKKEAPPKREKLAPRVFLKIEEQESDDESERRKTVFEELCRVFLGILKNGQSVNIKVKHIALYKLFPKLVNLSLPFADSTHSNLFQRIIVRGCMVEWGGEKVKISHFKPHLNLTRDFVKSGGLIISAAEA